jgi:hypothetical protein
VFFLFSSWIICHKVLIFCDGKNCAFVFRRRLRKRDDRFLLHCLPFLSFPTMVRVSSGSLHYKVKSTLWFFFVSPFSDSCHDSSRSELCFGIFFLKCEFSRSLWLVSLNQ